MSRRMGDGPSAVSIVSCSIPAEKWKKGLDGSLLASDQHFADVQFWKNFQRGSATATSFTNLRIANPRSRTGKTLLKELSDAGFEVKAEPVPVSSSGHAILFGVNDIHPRNDDCQHWAVYERLGPLMNESAHEYVIQFLKKYTTCEGEFIPFLGQHPGCADIKFIAHGSFGGAFRLSYLTGTDGVRKSCIIKRNDIDFTSFKYLMREKAFLADIEHPNIVKLLHQYVSPNYDASSLKSQNTVFFIEEDGGRTVQGYLREIYYNPSARPVPVQIIYRICSDILQALLYLESRGILHRDIKGDNIVISFYPDSDSSAHDEDLVAKLIDFGLARRHEGSENMDDLGIHNAEYDTAAEASAEDDEGGDSKLGIDVNKITQHAPECCEAPAQRPHRSFRCYSHKSDIWAFGTMVLWELMFCACCLNVEEMRRERSITKRMYNPVKHGAKTPAESLQLQLDSWDIANADSASLRQRITSQLRQRYDPSGTRSAEERDMFENLCNVLQGMCESNHDIRASAAGCLEILCGTIVSQATSRAAPLECSEEFTHVCKFMDSFCSSGHLQFSCKKLDRVDTSHSFCIESEKVFYDAVSAKAPWLYRRRLVSMNNRQLEEHIPDYCVWPSSASCLKPYPLFLPRNAFSQNSAETTFRIENLDLIAQGEWFTVFRYLGEGGPIIIKRANIYPISFKYLLREKAMLGYLNHRNIARPISVSSLNLKRHTAGLVDGGFYPLLCLGGKDEWWNDTYFMYEDGGSSLKEWLDHSQEVPLSDVRSIAIQLLEVLIYLRCVKVVHRDIRMESFVWSNNTLKLISLGKSRHMEPNPDEMESRTAFECEWAKWTESRTVPGFSVPNQSYSLLPSKNQRDSSYEAPEASIGGEPTYSWDLYAAGQVLLELLEKTVAGNDSQGFADIQNVALAMHHNEEFDREEFGNPLASMMKLNPQYKPIETAAADHDSRSLAVFAFIQSFFSS